MFVIFALLLVFSGTSLSQELRESCVDVQGVKHKLHDSYIGADGCNKCKCLEGGSACTKKFCPPGTPRIAAEANKCIDNQGNLHADGESYTHVDGCNTCICRPFGGSCTRKFCLKELKESSLCLDPQGNPRKEGESWLAQDQCNKCQCGVMGPVCTKTKCISKDPPKEPRDGEIVDETGDSPCRLEDGSTKFPGDSWLTADSCNICTCTGMNGNIDCTAEGCRVRFSRLMDPQKKEDGGEGSSGTKMTASLALAISFSALLL